MAIGINLDDDTNYYGSDNSDLEGKTVLTNKEIESLAEDLANGICIDDSWQDRYDIAFNLIHKRYGV